jgi:hypothetical protein
MAQEVSMTPGNVEFAVMHGATDAPTVDVVARGVKTLVDNAPYPAITDYISVPAADYTLEVKDASGTVTVATFAAPLSGLADSSAFVLASGFMDSTANQDGAAFGLIAVLPNGDVLNLPQLTMARLQVIHNAADPAAKVVDIYLDNEILLEDFSFRDATEFIDAPANQELAIGVAPGNSASAEDIIATIPVNLLAGETYIAIANGVLNPDQFADNPDGKSTAFSLLVKEMAREEGTDGNVDFFILHGATDAPAVNATVIDGPVLAENAAYSDMTDYISVPAARYPVQLAVASTGNAFITYDVDLEGLGGQSAVVIASGFLDPVQNQNGEGFALIGVLADGSVVFFIDRPTSVGELPGNAVPTQFTLDQNYPNPFNPTTTISFSLPSAEFVTLNVYNTLGQQVAQLVSGQLDAGQHRLTFEAADLVSGVYFYRIEAGSFTSTRQLVLLR